jgi:hypothetical protein
MNNTTQNQKTLDEMIDHIAEEENLRQLLSSHEIAVIDEMYSIDHYKRDNDRIGIIVDVKEADRVERTRILIDLRMGQPSVHQVYDALYDIGKGCDIKIIIHTNGYNDFDVNIPVADEYAVLSLVAQLQDDNVAVVLFEMKDASMRVEYVNSYQNWYQVNRLKNYKIPTRERFMAQTFWAVYFDSFNEGFYKPWETYRGGFQDINVWGAEIYIDRDMDGEITVFWDQEGVRYEIKQCNDSDEYLKKVLDIDMLSIKEHYGEDAVKFENVVGRLPRLYIKYSGRPFNWLYTATPAQITEFAQTMTSDVWGLCRQLEETSEKLYEMNVI